MEIETNLSDIITDTKEWVEEYRAGRLHWMDLDEPLTVAKNAGVTFAEASIGMSNAAANRILKACSFLREHRPELLKTKPTLSVSMMAYLPFVVGLIPAGPDREARFEDIVTKTINGELSESGLGKLSREFQGKGDEPTPPSETPESSRDLQTLRAAIQVLEHAVDRAVGSNGYERLRAQLDKECENLSVKLNCIADKHYKEEWENRRGMI